MLQALLMLLQVGCMPFESTRAQCLTGTGYQLSTW
jgi:hypothetical protein